MSSVGAAVARFAATPWATAAVVVAAVVVPLIGSWNRDFIALEADLILASRGSLADIAATLSGPLKDQSPLYLWMLHVWQAVLGEGPRTIRLLGLLWGGVAAGYTYLLGRTWRGHAVGLAAAALLIAMPAFVEHARGARMYMVYVACSVGAMAHAFRYLRGGHWADLLGCAGLCTAGIYTHFFGFGTAALALGALIGGALWSPPRRRAAWGAGAALGVGAATIPQLRRVHAAWSMAEGKGTFYSAPGGPGTFLEAVNGEQFYGNLAFGDVIPLPAPWPFLIAFAPLLALLVWGLVRLEGAWPRIVAAGWLFGAEGAMFALRAGLEADIRPRYLSFVMPVAALLIATALIPLRGVRWRRWLPLGLAAPVVALLIAGTVTRMAQRGRPYRDVVAWCEQRMDDGDRIATFPGWTRNAVRLHTDRPVYPGGNREMLHAAGDGGKLLLVESQMRAHDPTRELDWLRDRALLVEERQFHRTRVYVFDYDGFRAARRDLRRDWGRRVRGAEGRGARLAVVGDVVAPSWSQGPRQGALRILRGPQRQADLSVAFFVPPPDRRPDAADRRRAEAIAQRLVTDGVDVAALVGPGWRGRPAGHAAAADLPGNALPGTLRDGEVRTLEAGGVRAVVAGLSLEGPGAVDDALRARVRGWSEEADHVVLLVGWPAGPDGREVAWQRQAGRELLAAGATAVLGRSGGRDTPLEWTSEGVLATNLGTMAHDARLSREEQGWPGRAMVLLLLPDGSIELETAVLRVSGGGHPVPAERRPRVLVTPPPRDPIGARFRDRLGDAELSVVGGRAGGASFTPEPADPRDPLQLRGRRQWGPGWRDGVAEGVGTCGDFARPAIWAPPPPGGALVLHFAGVPLDDRIDGVIGVSDGEFDRERGGDRRPRLRPTTLEVEIDGEPVAAIVGADEPGWRGFRVATGARAGGVHDVTFRVHARRPRDHGFWFDAWTVAERPLAATPVAVTADTVRPVFREGLDGARVGVRLDDGRYRGCPATPGAETIPGEEQGPDGEGLLDHRRRCGRARDAWNVVATTRHVAGGELRDCIWAHPVDDGAIELEYPGVRIGARLAGVHGITDFALDRRDYPVYLEIESEGELWFRGAVATEPGWHPFAVDTAAWAGTRRDVLFRVETDKQRWRHYCFDADIR